ncbi:MAG: saccharopine dehydrogenase NADP-binding domain-containing protein [Saprospiraceae bacterium]|nr:saccharopine dehydrogenase NADP-binding domain-containing protein [Saprospiraceae bacterium]MDP4812393.1 saccharopine dehydrogenase NADP-binding domain-containing protein [Saprospiraceae bacterium]MDP4813482.1 saccharopine dehydrogenase NADP-binding domain-containing protein [Saprospiraceae bacterium]MDP4913173.1 saccharopine dehydrogenase NADP-binding domain-containing protein [Saprospiraceae bacterium]MDP5048473.1 saccharopine dehydrogenase NADP-binding domain-containing protein [Saprospir
MLEKLQLKITRIGLIGFGKTGKAVANVILQCKEFRLEWVLRQRNLLEKRSIPEFLGIESDHPGLIYSTSNTELETLINKHPVDIIIDFSSENGIYTYFDIARDRGIKIISAVSHYEEKERKMLSILAKSNVVFWSPNITLGVNYLLFAAKFLKKIAPWVDIQISEEHFKEKKGISGTAIKIAEALDLEKSDINSVRAGGIVGKHEIIFGFPYQTVRLIHESISREAFGNGVLFVAENLINKPIGLYNFEDLLIPYFASK